MTDAVKKIMSHYTSDNPGTRANIVRMLSHGRLGRDGKARHPPRRSGIRARSGAELRDEPAGVRSVLPRRARDRRGVQRVRGAARDSSRRLPSRYAGELPLDPEAQQPRLAERRTRSHPRADGVRRGRASSGMLSRSDTRSTPAPAMWREMYEQLRELAEEAKACGLAVIVWSYPRGSLALRRKARRRST